MAARKSKITTSEPLLPDPRDRPMVGFALACRILDIGPTKGYDLVKDGNFPVTVHKVGGVWKVPTHELHRFVGSEPADDASAGTTKTRRRSA